MAFINPSTGDWECLSGGLTSNGTSRSGITTHFTSFGVIFTGSTSATASGDGGDGFNLVLIAPIVIGSVVGIALLFLFVAIVVGVASYFIAKRHAQSAAINWTEEDEAAGAAVL